MKVGVLLPTFRDSADDALAVAAEAADLSLDGVFAYDHLWPMGQPERPALAPFPILAAVATRFPHLYVGPLVARVGLVSTDDLVQQFRTLGDCAPGRVIAALGTGDRLSASENFAYGIAYPSASERQDLLAASVDRLRDEFEVWVGAGAPRTNEIARSAGVALNMWNTTAHEATLRADGATWNWAGAPHDELEVQLDDLARAGATWAVLTPSVSLARLGDWRARTSAAPH
jgi:alkanesulfonate monooxygenase SsuD/methylene tetrahydromethanopterin reductase-like flavin-dependent oxidoreductase (luciferase family)